MLPKYALGKYMDLNMIYWADTESRNSHKISGLWKVYCSVGGTFISIASVLCFLNSSCTFFKRLRFALEWKKSVDMSYTNGKIGISSITIKLKIMILFCILDNNIITKEDMIIILIYIIKARYHNWGAIVYGLGWSSLFQKVICDMQNKGKRNRGHLWSQFGVLGGTSINTAPCWIYILLCRCF